MSYTAENGAIRDSRGETVGTYELRPSGTPGRSPVVVGHATIRGAAMPTAYAVSTVALARSAEDFDRAVADWEAAGRPEWF